MLISGARRATPLASCYLVQPCKRWGHKFPVEHTPERGCASFGVARACSFEALPDALVMRVAAAEAGALDHLQGVGADHPRRFAFREASLPEVHGTVARRRATHGSAIDRSPLRQSQEEDRSCAMRTP